MKIKGFTVVELIIAIVVILIITAIAIPMYNESRERALGKEAIANLKLLIAAEKIYRMKQIPPAYVACLCSDSAGCNAAGGCNTLLATNLNTQNWAYRVELQGGVRAFARRQGSGGYNNWLDCEYRMRIQDDKPSSYTNCPYP